MRSQARYALAAIEASVDECEELLHTNRYVTGHVYEAIHYLNRALLEIERLVRKDEGIIC